MCDSARMKILDTRQNLFKVSLRCSNFHADIRFCVFTQEIVNKFKKRLIDCDNSPIRSNNSPPAAYSRKMYSMVSCVRLPKNLRMFGCWRSLCMHTSFFTDSFASGCFSRSIIFMATASPDCRFMSNFTLWKKRTNC